MGKENHVFNLEMAFLKPQKPLIEMGPHSPI